MELLDQIWHDSLYLALLASSDVESPHVKRLCFRLQVMPRFVSPVRRSPLLAGAWNLVRPSRFGNKLGEKSLNLMMSICYLILSLSMPAFMCLRTFQGDQSLVGRIFSFSCAHPTWDLLVTPMAINDCLNKTSWLRKSWKQMPKQDLEICPGSNLRSYHMLPWCPLLLTLWRLCKRTGSTVQQLITAFSLTSNTMTVSFMISCQKLARCLIVENNIRRLATSIAPNLHRRQQCES